MEENKNRNCNFSTTKIKFCTTENGLILQKYCSYRLTQVIEKIFKQGTPKTSKIDFLYNPVKVYNIVQIILKVPPSAMQPSIIDKLIQISYTLVLKNNKECFYKGGRVASIYQAADDKEQSLLQQQDFNKN